MQRRRARARDPRRCLESVDMHHSADGSRPQVLLPRSGSSMVKLRRIVDDQRRALLDRVIQAEARWRAEAEKLRRFPWDVEAPLVTLRLADLRRMLRHYADGLITDAE